MVIKSDRYIENDIPLKKDKAIVVTSWNGHLIFLKETLKRYMQTGAYVICSYDHNGQMPPQDIIDIPHAWVFKHRTYGAEKRLGWLWDIVYAGGVLSNFNFSVVFTVNSDCIWEKPEGIDNMVQVLGAGAEMCSSSSNGTIHTCAVMYRGYVFHRFVDWIKETLKNNIPEGYSPEEVLRDFVRHNNIKNHPPEIQARYPKGHLYQGQVDHYSAYNQDSTWKGVLGYRNLGGEHKWSCLEHLEPVERKYIDLRNQGIFMSQHEKTTLLNYYLTNDRRWLYKYWAEGEDSYYNRIYKPLEYYGDSPLTDDFFRKRLGPPSERLGIFNRFDLNFDLRGIEI